MGIPLLQGQALSVADNEEAPKVVLINETMAERFRPGEDPAGQSIQWVFQGRGTGAHTIIGVVGDVQSFGLPNNLREIPLKSIVYTGKRSPKPVVER
jgi:hypothetical protein